MSHAPQLWEWEGEQLSATEIHRRCPAYSITAVRAALKEGVKSVEDLHRRYERGVARQKAGSSNNSRTIWRGTRACSTTRAG